MGLLKTLILGRDNGIRCKLRGMIFGGSGEDTSPNISYSAPAYSPSPAAPAPAVEDGPEPPREVTPPEGFEVVMHKGALKPGEVKEVIAAGTAVAVCNVDGNYHVVANVCPHAGGPLGEGSLDGSVLTCPYHGWAFEVTDGSCQTNADSSIVTYEVAMKGDAVCVRL